MRYNAIIDIQQNTFICGLQDKSVRGGNGRAGNGAALVPSLTVAV
jgi:hypothetical protein